MACARWWRAGHGACSYAAAAGALPSASCLLLLPQHGNRGGLLTPHVAFCQFSDLSTARLLATGAASQGPPHGALARRCNCGQPHQARKGKEHRLHVRLYYVWSCGLGVLLWGGLSNNSKRKGPLQGGHCCNLVVCFCACSEQRALQPGTREAVRNLQPTSFSPIGSVITSPTWAAVTDHIMLVHPPPFGHALQQTPVALLTPHASCAPHGPLPVMQVWCGHQRVCRHPRLQDAR